VFISNSPPQSLSSDILIDNNIVDSVIVDSERPSRSMPPLDFSSFVRIVQWGAYSEKDPVERLTRAGLQLWAGFLGPAELSR
jgi:hypothetical protein